MKKRFLSALLILCVAAALLPTSALADAPAAPTSWAELQAALTSGLNIRLTQDIIAAESDTALEVPIDRIILLDLNGKIIDRGLTQGRAHGNVITAWGTLIITDSSTGEVANQGKITGGYNSTEGSYSGGGILMLGGASKVTLEGGNIVGNKSVGWGGGVKVEGGLFTMTGGKISGNVANYGEEPFDNFNSCGGGVYAGTIFNMTGGEISGNSVCGSANGNKGGGIFFYGTVSIGGTAVVKNNKSSSTFSSVTGTASGGITDNVYLQSGRILGTAAIFTAGASVGVSTQKLPTIYVPVMVGGTPTADYSSFFTSDNNAYMIQSNEVNTVLLALKPHVTEFDVTLPAGSGYTVAAHGSSVSPVTSGGSFSFTVTISGGYHKEAGFAVKANGTTLIADGSGVYTISGIAQNQAVSVEGVVQDTPAPGGYIPPDDTIVYNDTNKPNATIWLSGSGLSGNDLLVTQVVSSGSNYNAMLKLADKDDIFRVYNIALESGKKPTGSAMYLTFDLTEKYAGQAFTLVHKKADGTYEYLHAVAGADGKIKFGPVHELSPFMLVKGRLLHVSTGGVVGIPQTGDAANSLPVVLLAFAALCYTGAMLYKIRRTRA